MRGTNDLFNLIAMISNELFSREDNFLAKRELGMISRNCALGGSADGFRYMGAAYSELSGTARGRASLPRLHTSLGPEMEALQSERKALGYEKDKVKQALAIVLKDCRSWQDVRDALPNGVKRLIPQCANLDRTKEEAFTLLGNDRAYQQYMVLKDKIEYFTATQLLY